MCTRQGYCSFRDLGRQTAHQNQLTSHRPAQQGLSHSRRHLCQTWPPLKRETCARSAPQTKVRFRWTLARVLEHRAANFFSNLISQLTLDTLPLTPDTNVNSSLRQP